MCPNLKKRSVSHFFSQSMFLILVLNDISVFFSAHLPSWTGTHWISRHRPVSRFTIVFPTTFHFCQAAPELFIAKATITNIAPKKGQGDNLSRSKVPLHGCCADPRPGSAHLRRAWSRRFRWPGVTAINNNYNNKTRQSKQCGFSIYTFDNLKSKSMVRLIWAEKMVLSGLVFARKIARMILIQNI